MTLILHLLLWWSTAIASPYGFTKYSFNAILEGSSFTTTSDYDPNGNVVAFPGNTKFSELKVDLFSSYDFSNRWGVFTDITFKNEDSLGTRLERTNTGLSEFTAGGGYLIWNRFVNVIPEVSVTTPMHSPDISGALLDDQALYFTTKVNVSKKFSFAAVGAYGGVKFRNQGLSTQAPYALFGISDIGSFFIDARIYGEASFNNDQYTATPQARANVTADVDSGSLIYFAVNPSFTNAALRIGWRIEPSFYVALGADQTLLGKDSAVGTRFLASIGLLETIGGGRTRLRELREAAPAAPEPDELKNIKRFKVDTQSEEIADPNGGMNVETKKIKRPVRRSQTPQN